MKKSKTLLISVVAVLAVVLAACGNQSKGNKQHEQASFRNEPTSSKPSVVQDTIENSNALWYAAGGVNTKSESGMEAFYFNKKTNRVTIYNVSKYYKSYSAAKSANALNKEGTVRYTFKTNKNNQTVIKFAGKLSDIPMTQTMTFKDTTKGTNKSTKLGVSGFKVVRNVDYDKTNAIFVQADN